MVAMCEMSSGSGKFEKQIHRIHQLLDEAGADITWNDRLPDPDNPEQLRQIDITIRRDDDLTLVECRIHKNPQDVKWIEELIGRRVSLRADAVIAVSASGFTRGAIRKAAPHGILLRTLRSLTEEEIQGWGRKTRIWLTFYEYTDVSLDFVFDRKLQDRMTFNELEQEFRDGARLYSLFDLIADAIDKENPGLKRPCRLKATLIPENFRIGAFKPAAIVVVANAQAITQELNIASVYMYDAPGAEFHGDAVIVEKVDMGDFEITQSSNRVSIAVDLTPVRAPANSQFRFLNTDFGREVTEEALWILGMYPMQISLHDINVGLVFRDTAHPA